VLEGEHWPSDVLGGWLYGVFWLILGLHVYSARRRQATGGRRQ
jgi:membrane-associated phospholipid phosphatase